MIVDGIFGLKDRVIITGNSKWEDELRYCIGDVVSDGTKQWKITDVSSIHQGCFDLPEHRYHAVMVEPIGHDEMPKVSDVLTKQ